MQHPRFATPLLLGLASACFAVPTDIVGEWLFQSDEVTVRFEASPDGTFQQTTRTAEGTETYSGTFTLTDDRLSLRTEDGNVIELRCQMVDNDTIQVTDEEGNGLEFVRQKPDGPAGPGRATEGQGGVPLPRNGPGDLVPMGALEPSAGGHIVFTRLVPLAVAGGVAGGVGPAAPIPKLFVMSGEGGSAEPFLVGEAVTSLKEPRWSGSYAHLAFTSDFRTERSALLTDCFVCPTGGTPAVRITGNELKGPAPAGYGAITGIIVDSAPDIVSETGLTLGGIHITAQGALGISHPGQAPPDAGQDVREALRQEPRRFVIPHVAAGNSVWVKIWVNTNIGRVFTCPVKAGEVTDLGKVTVNEATFAASKPSVTPDGRYCVGMSVVNASDSTTRAQTGGLGRTGGSASLSIFDVNTGATVAQVSPEQLGVTSIVGPVVSPDGRSIACGIGQPTMESLVILSLAEVLAGAPRPRLVVPGERLLPSPQTMGRAWLVGCGSIAWSPEGQRLAFCRSWMSEDVTGDLWIVNADGSGLTQLTHVAANQMALNPTFSPDGRRLAFTLITGLSSPLKIEHLMTRRYQSDIYTIGLDGSPAVQLTNDGVSCEPAWGR